MLNSYQGYQDSLKIRRESLQEAAETFLSRGTSVVILKAKSIDPLSDKLLKDHIEVEKSLTDNPYSNVGVIVGKENNLIAIKLERESDYEPEPKELIADLERQLGPLPSTMTILYPNNTQYYLFEYPSAEIKITSLDYGIKVLKSDLYGTTGLILLQSSELNNGQVKELSQSNRISQLPDAWIKHICINPTVGCNSDVTTKVEEAPLIEVIQEEDSSEANDMESSVVYNVEVLKPPVESEVLEVSEENCNVTQEDYLQLLVAKMVTDGMHPSETVKQAKLFIVQHELHMDQKELFMMVFTEFSKTDRYAGAGSLNESIMRFIADAELEAFRDNQKQLCCKIKPTGTIVVLSTRAGSSISQYLTYRMLQLTNALPKDTEIKMVLKIIEAVGQFECDEVEVFNRVGKHDGAFCYDLGNQNAIKVTGEGWQVVEVPPIFRRYASHQVQFTPKAGGRIERFFDFVNHESKDRLLLSVYMISSFIPEIAHPVLYVYGSHGSAKSSMSSKIKTVIDPGTLDKLILNNKKDEVVRNLQQHYVSLYDNISHITNEISDVFCIASTGGGMDNRKKYTDAESHIMSFKHCVILNGIKLAIKKPDLLDRSILIKLKRVKAKDEIEINERFSAALPEILGGIFDALARAKALYSAVEIDDLPRMASFAKWGYAIAEALGGHGKQFLQDYRNNIAEQNDLIASGSSLAHAVLVLMEKRSELHTTIGKAHEELSKLVKTDKQDRTFPSRSKDLRPYLEELGPVMDSFGIRYEFGKVKSNIGWTVKFINVNETLTE